MLNKQVNEDNNQVIPYHKFYVPELKDRINLRKDYLKWLEHTQLQNQSGVTVKVSILKILLPLN